MAVFKKYAIVDERSSKRNDVLMAASVILPGRSEAFEVLIEDLSVNGFRAIAYGLDLSLFQRALSEGISALKS